MATLRNFEEYPKNFNHAESVLTFQDIYKCEIKYANSTVIQWAFYLGGGDYAEHSLFCESAIIPRVVSHCYSIIIYVMRPRQCGVSSSSK